MITENIARIKRLIQEAAEKSGRSADSVKLVAVSKRFPASVIEEACAGGQLLFGENYIQEVQLKREKAPKNIRFHFIGHLQTNKAKIAAQCCDVIETIDRLKLGISLNRHLENLNKSMDVLVQVNIGEDPKKAGVAKEDAEILVKELQSLPNLKVRGLMTMPPIEPTAEHSRRYFRQLRLLARDLADKGFFTTPDEIELSMGMSSDYKVAIEEGATIVRVGTAIFGNRPAIQ